MMLDTPLSHWLPLQPLSTAPTAAQDHHHASTSDSRAARPLPGCTCSIEALRETFTPLYYSSTPSTGRTPPSAVAISHASTRDLAELLRLHAATLPVRYDASFFVSLLLNANYTVLIAKTRNIDSDNSPNTILGCATAFLHPHTNELELLTLCVDPKYSRNGLATSLLQEIASRALSSSSSCRKQNLKAILRVQTSNIPAIKLYTKLGFLIDGIETNYYNGHQAMKGDNGSSAAYRMKKSIERME